MRFARAGIPLLAVLTTACVRLQTVSLERLNHVKPDTAWVTKADQSVLALSVPAAVGDTLIGYVDGKAVQVPRTDVKRVVVWAVDPTRSALFAVGTGIGFGAFFFSMRSSERRYTAPGYCDEYPKDPECRP